MMDDLEFTRMGNPRHALKDKVVIDNGCSRHMTGNISYLSDFEEINGGYVAFGRNPKGGKITGKGKIKTGKLDFDDVYFVKELKFNLFSVSQMCDKKNNVLFTDTECIVLSFDFKFPDDNHGLLRVLGENNMYNVDLKNIVPSGDLTCLFAKSTLDESNLWHRRLGHINFKTMNKLVKGNLVRGLPSKVFKNNHTCVACKKGKQYRASWIKREFSVARTPQQNDIAKRKNRILIEAARTVLAYSLLPIPFWAEAVNTVCYVQNRVLVTKHHNKTPYELLLGRTPSIGFMRPFGCHVTILNTLDPLGKFNGKADEGFLVGYSVSSKAFKVYNSRTRIVQETLHINFLENQPNVAGSGPTWLFDIDTLTQSMNYQLIELESEVHVSPSSSAKTKEQDDKTKREVKGKNMPALEDITYSADEEDVGAEADFSNLETNITVSPIPTTRVHKDHLVTQIIGGLSLGSQTRSMTRMVKEQGRLTQINNDDFHTCMFACFLSQEEPKRVHQALKDPSWIEAMQEELLQFKQQKV
nr:ribonuclease H-like domain-containing protein [Tanacetum cinerariifolium]